MSLKERIVNIRAFAAIIILLPLSAPLSAETGAESAAPPDTVFADRFQQPDTPPPTEKPVKPEPTGDFSLEVASYWGGPIKGGDVHGDYAYIANGPMLRILDISDETNPVEIGALRLGTAGTVNDVKVRGNYAFVAANAGDYFSIVDVADPSQPVKIRSFEVSTSGGRAAQEVALYGDYAYVRDLYGSGGAIRAYHIADPLNATSAGRVTESDYETTSMLIHDGYLYAGPRGGSSGALEIYDLSINPGNPPLVGEWNTPIPFGSMAAMGNRLYGSVVLDNGRPRLMTMDISSPDSPVITGISNWGSDRGAENLTVMSGYLFSAIRYSEPNIWQHADSLEVYDLAEPDQPELVGRYRSHGAVERVLDVRDGRLYVADAAEGFVVLDTGDPSFIRAVGNYHSPAVLRRAHADGDLLYVTDAYGGFTVLDVSNPDSPIVVGNYLARRHDVAGIDTFGIDKVGNVVYLAAGGAGLLTVDVSDPTQPVTLGTMRISTMAFPSSPWCGARFREIKVRDGIAYIGYVAHFCSYASVWLLTADVSDPLAPVALDVHTSGGATYGALTDILFGPQNSIVLDSGPALILNASDPKNLDVYFGPGGPNHFAIDVESNWKYSLVGYSFNGISQGLHVHDISNPANPVPVFWLETIAELPCGRFMGIRNTNSTIAIQEGDDRLYVLNGNTRSHDAGGVKWGGSIFVFDVTNPVDPVCANRLDLPGGGAIQSPHYATAPPQLLIRHPAIYLTTESNGLTVLRRS